jgi:small subunit ribosomal protein S19e
MTEAKKNLVFEVEPQQYNLKLAEALKNVPEFKAPEWTEFIKSSSSKERPIEDPDFWYKRAASILKQIYKMKVVGVNRLRTKYGSKKGRGMKPERFVKSGGKIIRTILQQADKAGFTESVKDVRGLKSKRKGRKLTDKGRKFMEEIK